MVKEHESGGTWPVVAGLLAGVVLDRVVPDPRRGHPVAAFGHAMGGLERRAYAPTRSRGAVFAALGVLPVTTAATVAGRALRRWPWVYAATVATATWAVVGGSMLTREACHVADALERGDLKAARQRLPHLCGRDPRSLDEAGLCRATVESVAENTSDAVVAPLFWGALLGLPGLLGYRAVNTLDAMVGHRDSRYRDFGWASARADDVANWLPARLTAAIAILAAPVAGGRRDRAWRTRAAYGHRHPSPNAGQCEAAFAGALGLRLGGVNTYGDRVERRPELGEGRPPEVGDIRRAVRLARAVTAVTAGVSAGIALVAHRGPRHGTKTPIG